MDLVPPLEPVLAALAALLRSLLELLSVLCVATGLLAVLRQALPWVLAPRARSRPSPMALRLRFGGWLSMALEFQLGADIVATTTAPSGANLIQLAAIAVIRTFLNAFLAREIEAEQRLSGAAVEGGR
jgi:uncharacterized membrane protein